MLNHTKKIRKIYEDIQRRIYYMIPEKWDKMYLYSSILDEPDSEGKTGELFFYYIPKGILRKKPINVYEIPSKFNLDEGQYLKLVEILYKKIKELREEFKKSERKEIWSNITISIENIRFKVEYDYEDLSESNFSSYERHIIWRCKNLGIMPEQLNKEEKEILERYNLAPKTLVKKEYYDTGIYISDIQNMVSYSRDNYNYNGGYDEEKYIENDSDEKNDEISYKNQILFSKDEIEKAQSNKEKQN